MNTIAFESTEDLTDFDQARKSILNYGLPDFVHRSIDEGSVSDVQEEIEAALLRFEPRLAQNSIHAKRDMSVDANELKVRFLVTAELCCEPVNVPIEFVADLELENGSFRIHRL